MKQSDIIMATEGDAWFRRNRDKSRLDDPVLKEILDNPRILPLSVLEIGCGTGWRLNALRDRFYDSSFTGCDLSWEAIQEGRKRYPKLALRAGAADTLGYGSGSFDLVILGFFMYLLDREDLFRVVAEVDRVLADNGTLVIHDFHPETPHSRAYEHDPRLITYKMNYPELWMGNPAYVLDAFKIWGSGNDRESVHTLRKRVLMAWPRRA
jgi:SAM-dependent methyltransferase